MDQWALLKANWSRREEPPALQNCSFKWNPEKQPRGATATMIKHDNIQKQSITCDSYRKKKESIHFLPVCTSQFLAFLHFLTLLQYLLLGRFLHRLWVSRPGRFGWRIRAVDDLLPACQLFLPRNCASNLHFRWNFSYVAQWFVMHNLCAAVKAPCSWNGHQHNLERSHR